MKVKLFGKINLNKKGLEVLDLEPEINEWLKKNPDIKIISIKQSAAGGTMIATKLFVSVWYE